MVETNDSKMLQHGGTRETISRANREHRRSSGIGPCGQILDIESKRFARHGFRKEVVLEAEYEIIVEIVSIGINGGRRSSQILLHRQPRACQLLLCDQWVKLPTNLLHVMLLRHGSHEQSCLPYPTTKAARWSDYPPPSMRIIWNIPACRSL